MNRVLASSRYWPRQSLLSGLLLIVSLAGLVGCGSGQTTAAGPSKTSAKAEPAKGQSQDPSNALDVPARTQIVGTVPEGTYGPRLLLTDSSRLVVWAEPSGKDSGWYALDLPYDKVAGPAVRLADSRPGLRFIEVSQLGATGEQPDGALAVGVRTVGSSTVIEATVIEADGTPGAASQIAAETPAEILWLEAHGTEDGALLVWAERAEGAADLYALEMRASGPVGVPTRLVEAARSWQLVRGVEGFWLATLEGTPDAGRVLLRGITQTGAAVAAPSTLATTVKGGLDLDLVASHQRLVVAFTQQHAYAARIERIVLDANGKVVHPSAALTPPRGHQALLRLVSAGVNSPVGEITALWEEPGRAPEGHRNLLMGTLGDDGNVAEVQGELSVYGNDPLLPLAAVSGHGPLLVTQAPRCMVGTQCEPSPARRLFVQAPRGLTGAVTAELLAIRQLSGRPADMAWDLRCGQRGCFSLVADSGAPTAVFVASVDEPQGSVPPLRLIDKAQRPRVVAEEAIAEVPELSKLVGHRQADTLLISWVSFFDPGIPYTKPNRPAPDGRLAPVRAQLTTQTIAGDEVGDVSVENENIISYRARSLGGVAMTDERDGQRLLGWSALESGKPQVFLTLIDRQGKKLRQKMLTRAKGEVTDVTVIALKKGYAVAWVDARDGTGEVYVARVDDQLRKVGKERAVSRGAEGPTGLSLAQLDGEIVLTWSDARGASKPGFGDIYAVGLSDPELKNVESPRRLAATSEHSHSPRLYPLGLGKKATALLTWVESVPSLTRSVPSRLAVAEVDGAGKVIASPRHYKFEGEIRGYSMECEGEQCRAVVLVDTGRQGELWALSFGGDELAPVRLLALGGRPSHLASPLLRGDQVLFVDGLPEARWLLQRLTVQW